MKVEGEKIVVNKNVSEVFGYLSDLKNFESLMPDNVDKFSLHESGQGFKIGLKNMPELGMKLKETIENEKISFESPTPSFQYDLDILLKSLSDTSSEIGLSFNGKFNSMIEMMAKKPLKKFIAQLTEKALATLG